MLPAPSNTPSFSMSPAPSNTPSFSMSPPRVEGYVVGINPVEIPEFLPSLMSAIFLVFIIYIVIISILLLVGKKDDDKLCNLLGQTAKEIGNNLCGALKCLFVKHSLAITMAVLSFLLLLGVRQGSFDLTFKLMCIIPPCLLVFQIYWVYYAYKEHKDQKYDSPVDVQIHYIFEDWSVPLGESFLIAVAQCALIILYVTGISMTKDPNLKRDCKYDCTDKEEYTYYYVFGLLIVFSYVVGQGICLRQIESMTFWVHMFNVYFADETFEIKDSSGQIVVKKSAGDKKEWSSLLSLRFVCCLVINSIGLSFTVLSIPFQVAVGDPEVIPIDFVLKVIGGMFIIKLDDLPVSITHKIVKN